MQQDSAFRKQEGDSLHVGSGWSHAQAMVDDTDAVPWVHFFSSGADSKKIDGASSSSFQTRTDRRWKEFSVDQHTGEKNLSNYSARIEHSCTSFTSNAKHHMCAPTLLGVRHARDPAPHESEFERSKRSRMSDNETKVAARIPQARKDEPQRMRSDYGKQADFEALSVGPGCPWLENKPDF
jgi:hypothetical protein